MLFLVVYMSKLNDFRKKIDAIDRNMVKSLSLRFSLAKQIASYKKENNIRITDKKRELQVMKNIKKYSKSNQVIIKIFKNIITYSKKLQK